MKRTMYQAARHTPKRKVVSSSLAGGAKKADSFLLLPAFRLLVIMDDQQALSYQQELSEHRWFRLRNQQTLLRMPFHHIFEYNSALGASRKSVEILYQFDDI